MFKSTTAHRLHALCAAVVVAASASSARAQTAAAPPPAPPLTFHGVTLYGTVDVGVAYLTHGAPATLTYGSGLPFLIQKYSNRPVTGIISNGLSQSKIGLAGTEPLNKDLSVVFRIETGFVPTTLRLVDGPASLLRNNGRPLAEQITGSDTSRAGQWDQGAGYFGLSSKGFGTLTYGRQNGLILDDLGRYDPQLQAQAFSPIGSSGVAGGAGDTETARLDDSLKYIYARGPVRLGLMHQFRDADGVPGGADQASIGLELGGLSLDAVYTQLSDAVANASLTAAQNAVHPGTLSATVSDNVSASLQGSYKVGKAKVYGGYEQITYANPDHPLAAGVSGLGGYTLGFVSNTAYTHRRVLAISWTGVRYALTPRLDLSAAYYRYDQNSYHGDGCADRSASSCSGNLNAMSALATYRLDQHFDLYGGVNYSHVADGLASGYLQTTAMGPMLGARFGF